MGQVLFYQLSLSPLEALIGTLAERALAQGWRVELRGVERTRMEWLDTRLWLGSEAGFLAHGLAGGPQDAAQPLLLTYPAAPAGAGTVHQALMAIDGAEVDPAEVAALERVWVIFDGLAPEPLERARAQWRALTAADLAAQYWSEAGGRWEKKSERGGAPS